MSDDYTIVTFFVEQLVDALGQLQPNLVVHVLRADVDQLLAGDVGQIKHLWNGVDERLHTYLSGGIG